MWKSKTFAWLSACLIVPCATAQKPPFSPEALSLFDKDVQPILKANCQACHNDKNRSSGLSLASRDAALAGGNRGAAIKAGSPDESLLIRAIEQSGDLKMPPSGKLQPA